MTILDKILADKSIEIAERKRIVSIQQLTDHAYFGRTCVSLKQHLLTSNSGIIAEFKRKSPSLGWICENANVVAVTQGYCLAGASGVSILTDFSYFGGTPTDVIEARKHLTCPILRKDFVIDAYQIYETKAMGADVVLLIAAALTVQQTLELAHQAHELGLEVLLEVHNEHELKHANRYVDMLGVNNRNLKTFELNIQTSYSLAGLIPDAYVKISESGISSSDVVQTLRTAGYKGFLMGETFMKTEKPDFALLKFLTELTS